MCWIKRFVCDYFFKEACEVFDVVHVVEVISLKFGPLGYEGGFRIKNLGIRIWDWGILTITNFASSVALLDFIVHVLKWELLLFI